MLPSQGGLVAENSIKKNNNRKPEYRLVSQIMSVGIKKTLIKRPANQSAERFIFTILEREAVAEKGFKDRAIVVRSRLIDGALFYPWIACPSMEGIINKHVVCREPDKAYALLEEYDHFLRNFTTKTVFPHQFIKYFAIPRVRPHIKFRCLDFGPLDCIPANILIGSSSWYIIDHEWTFDFPVPVDFIIFRGIYSLIINLQKTIQSCVSSEFPVALFQGYGRKRTFIPYDWLDFLHRMEIAFQDLLLWEYSFQQKIQMQSKLGRLRLSAKPKKICEVRKPSKLVCALMGAFRWLQEKRLVRS